MKYKHDIKNPEMITRELKRCADELASCDLTMQTIRNSNSRRRGLEWLLKILLAEDEEALSRVYKAALEHQRL